MTTGTPFLSATVTGDSPDQAVNAALAALGGRVSSDALGFVYVTEPFAAALPRIIAALRHATGVAHWTGCVGAGVCGTAGAEIHGRGALSIMLADLAPGCFRVFDTLLQPEDVPDYGHVRGVAGETDWDDAQMPLFGLVHADPRNSAVPDLISLLPEATEAYLVGGLTATPTGALAQVADDVTGGGVSGVLLCGSVPVAVGLSQGCRPVGPTRLITTMDGDWVAALDNRPAVDALRADLGEEDFANLRDLAGTIHAALPVEGADTADFVVRTLVAVDLDGGRLGVSADLREGDRLMLVRRDAAAAEADLRRMIRRLRDRAATPPRGALYISCLARGPHLFGTEGAELAIVAEELGADVPLTGFFAHGEINHNRLYAYTGVLTLFL